VLHAKIRNRTCQALDWQGQGQGLKFGPYGQGQGLTSLVLVHDVPSCRPFFVSYSHIWVRITPRSWRITI